jgi:multiple sugar transport system permease protein
VLSITGAFGFGGVVDALCGNPSTDYVAWTLQHHLAEYMGVRFEYGYASAISVMLFLIMMGANMLVQKFLAKVGQ